MKQLTDTQLFRFLRTKGTFNPGETAVAPMYDEFVRSVVALCTTANNADSAYFILHYTLLELESYRSGLSTAVAEKKYTVYILLRPLPILH